MMIRESAALVALAAAAVAFCGTAAAQPYPTKPIRMVVANAAGGPADLAARIFATGLSELLGQQIVVDNRAGAGGSVAGDIVASAPADGYTLCAMANGTVAIAPHILKLRYDVGRDMAPVALIGNSPLVLMVHPAVPARSVSELIAFAKAKPGVIHFSSSQQGSTAHLSAELLKMMTGIDIVHVPYKGAAQALVGVMSGEVQMLISGLSASLPVIKSGKVRALGITSPSRLELLPELPTIAETVPGYEADSWYVVLARAGTPQPIIARLNELSRKNIGMPEVRAKLVGAGISPEPLTVEQVAAKIRRETERWGKVVRAAGVVQQ
jgi:tripartite-type tricarboxylate transporter receptor subunit TctC